MRTLVKLTAVIVFSFLSSIMIRTFLKKTLVGAPLDSLPAILERGHLGVRPYIATGHLEATTIAARRPVALQTAPLAIHRVMSTVTPLPAEKPFEKSKCSFTPPKELLEAYDLGRFLGAGAFTEVYEATHKQTRKEYAIKFLPKDDIDPALPYSFESETAPNLNHPHIVQYYDSFDTPPSGTPALCLVMELFGHRLRTYVETFGRPTLEQALQWTRQLADALTYLHSKSICHGDVRPSNVHVDGSVAKLMDLGMARHVGQDGEDSLEELKEDVRGLARVLLELLVGRVAKDGEFDGSHTPALNLLDKRKDVPTELQQALHSVFEKRTPTAAEFRDLLL